MVRVALRGLLGRKFRAILTALAVILGVAMISGTFVLTDTINNAFDTLFTDSYTGTDVVISGQQAFETDFGQPPSFDEAVFDDVLALDGVDSAVRAIQDFAVLTNKDGGPITTGGAPTLAFGLDTEAQSDVFERFSPLDLVDGTWPIGLGQVAIDPATANDEGYVVGETIGIRARGPSRTSRSSGWPSSAASTRSAARPSRTSRSSKRRFCSRRRASSTGSRSLATAPYRRRN